MEDVSSPVNKQQSPASAPRRAGMLFLGTIAVLIVSGIGIQVWRASDGKAAERGGSIATTETSAEVLDVAYARVNGESITFESLARECVERFGRNVLDEMVKRLIIQQECARNGITVSANEVDQEILKIAKGVGLGLEQYYNVLAEQNLTPLQYRRDIIWPLLALKKLAGTDENIRITREMIQQAYEDNYGPRVKARMIRVDNIRRATEIWEKAKSSPEEFDRLARDFSMEPNSRALGGVIPPIRRHSGAHPELRRAAFAMSTPGEISGVIQEGVGRYTILQFEDYTEPVDHNMADVEAELYADLQQREVERMVGETFERLDKAARVDNFMTGESRGQSAKPDTDAAQSAAADETLTTN